MATFSNLSIDKVGTGYTLTASRAGLTGATSAAFNITPGRGGEAGLHRAADQRRGGRGNRAGGAGDGAGRVQQHGDQLHGEHHLAIGTNPGGGTLSGTTTVAAVGGRGDVLQPLHRQGRHRLHAGRQRRRA